MNYTIKQGNHYASEMNLRPPHFNLKSLSFSVTMEENCLYNLGNENNKDINKVYGVTWGLDPLNNSFLIGWNCFKQNGLTQFFHYSNNHFLRNPAPSEPHDKTLLFEAPVKTTQRFSLFIDRPNNKVHVGSENVIVSVPYNFNNVPIWGYYNRPYFGGNQVAQHDMNLEIIHI